MSSLGGISEVNGYSSTMENASSQSIHKLVSPFRKQLKGVSDDLGPEEVQEMKNLILGEQLLRKDQHSITTGMELFLYLETAGHISHTNVDLLVQLLLYIGRKPLADKLRNAYP